MPNQTIVISASSDDVHSAANANDSGQAPAGAITTPGLTATVLAPGSHGTNDEYTAGFRFLALDPDQGDTIDSAIFEWTPAGTWDAGPGVVRFFVACQDSDDTITFALAAEALLNATVRPRTTAETLWTQTSVTVNVAQTVDITSAVQEVIDRVGWATGNDLVVIVDTHPDTTLGEFQEVYAFDHATGQAPRLLLTWTAGGAGGQTVNANAIAAATTIPNAAVTPGAASVAAQHIGAATAVPNAAVTTLTTIAAQAIGATTTVPDPAVTTGPVTVAANLLAAATNVHNAAVSAGAVTIDANHLTAATSVPSAAVTTQTDIAAEHVAATTTVPNASVTVGSVTIDANAIGPATSVPNAAVTQDSGLQTVNANHLTAATTVLNATVSHVAPAAPTDLVATAISESQIDLSWTDNATNEDLYVVERSADGVSGWTVISGNLPANSTSYSDMGLDPAATWFYRVRCARLVTL